MLRGGIDTSSGIVPGPQQGQCIPLKGFISPIQFPKATGRFEKKWRLQSQRISDQPRDKSGIMSAWNLAQGRKILRLFCQIRIDRLNILETSPCFD
ncbi:MAG TPA: hypothetical protein DEA80_20610 [Afipia sp.]|nr:hypothetical protein [Afipia sp.]HAP12585.1 hypothetical protein [Afipia sp.]HAP45984.1 hypothetical protein [Afipia sp.]HAQ94805.1 hypothetical protein [Afipia sp.]HBF53718.1 hypothetical protein [Afipia sp.]